MNTIMTMEGIVMDTIDTEKIERVAGLKGILREAMREGKNYVITRIDRKYFYIDPNIQTPERTERSIEKLVKNWNPVKCMPLVGIPDFINGWMDIADGTARIRATENKEGYQEMDVMVILNAPTDPVERKKFIAELFINQDRDSAKVTPAQKHGSRVVLGDPAALAIEKAKAKYNFEFYKRGGKHDKETNVGSYVQMYRIAKKFKFEGLDWVFDLCKKAGFDRKPMGYSKYILGALYDMYTLYPENREDIKEILSEYLRDYNPKGVKANAMATYPMLFEISAVSLFLEDVYSVLAHKKMKRKIESKNGKVTIKEITITA